MKSPQALIIPPPKTTIPDRENVPDSSVQFKIFTRCLRHDNMCPLSGIGATFDLITQFPHIFLLLSALFLILSDILFMAQRLARAWGQPLPQRDAGRTSMSYVRFRRRRRCFRLIIAVEDNPPPISSARKFQWLLVCLAAPNAPRIKIDVIADSCRTGKLLISRPGENWIANNRVTRPDYGDNNPGHRSADTRKSLTVNFCSLGDLQQSFFDDCSAL